MFWSRRTVAQASMHSGSWADRGGRIRTGRYQIVLWDLEVECSGMEGGSGDCLRPGRLSAVVDKHALPNCGLGCGTVGAGLRGRQ